MQKIFGAAYSREDIKRYSAEYNIGDGYPPAYAVHSHDDEAVHFHTSLRFCETLRKAGIPCMLREVDGCGHGFALGRGTPAEGWLEQAMDFWRRNIE